MRCQLWDGDRLVVVKPVTFDDVGRPSDVFFTPQTLERVDRLVFVWGGRTFVAPLHPPRVVRVGETLHLALAHLRLLDRFGTDVLAAGRT